MPLIYIVLLGAGDAGPYEHLFPFSMFEKLMETSFDLYWKQVPFYGGVRHRRGHSEARPRTEITPDVGRVFCQNIPV